MSGASERANAGANGPVLNASNSLTFYPMWPVLMKLNRNLRFLFPDSEMGGTRRSGDVGVGGEYSFAWLQNNNRVMILLGAALILLLLSATLLTLMYKRGEMLFRREKRRKPYFSAFPGIINYIV